MTVTLSKIIDELCLTVLTEKKDFSDIHPTSGYISDLLSCVMTGAKKNGLWVTLQAHGNIVAVASLLDVAAVIITEAAIPDQSIIDKANDENVVLLSSNSQSFEVVGKLWDLGIRQEKDTD
ncbi:MAG TPA: hypothetical protein PKD55_04770 [Bellilinea sp.]|nr:hypothetical protein [Bellilinea sp.]